MGKIIVIGDIHGRTIWRDIVSQPFDKVIFLGDYVTTHENISSEQQIYNLNEILEFKENAGNKVILLRGNHDIDSLGYKWSKCSGRDLEVFKYMSRDDFRKRFLRLTQWIYIYRDILFSHAGVSEVWLKEIAQINLEDVNKQEPTELFGFYANSPCDIYGTSPTQPPTWIRPTTLAQFVIGGYTQVIGHTQVAKIVNAKESVKNKQDLWLCDALGVKQYLIIDNGNFIIKTIENGSKN